MTASVICAPFLSPYSRLSPSQHKLPAPNIIGESRREAKGDEEQNTRQSVHDSARTRRQRRRMNETHVVLPTRVLRRVAFAKDREAWTKSRRG